MEVGEGGDQVPGFGLHREGDARGGGGVTVAGDMGMMVLVVLFAMITSPIIGNRLGHVSLKEGIVDRDTMSRDDEAERSERPLG